MGARADRLLVINAAEGLLQILFAERPPGSAAWTQLLFDETPAASQGAEILTPRIRAGLDTLGMAPRDLSHIAAVRGPGSFTGLRLALATAAGLARATGAVQAGLDYMPLLALGAATIARGNESLGQTLWVLTHARRDLVHIQGFTCAQDLAVPKPPSAEQALARPPRPHAMTGILVLSPAKALGMILAHAQDSGRAAALCGSGLRRNLEVFETCGRGGMNGDGLILLAEDCDHPTAQAMLRLADSALYAAADIQPLYARASDAEDNIEHIASTLRLDPAAARLRLEQLTGKLPTVPV